MKQWMIGAIFFFFISPHIIAQPVANTAKPETVFSNSNTYNDTANGIYFYNFKAGKIAKLEIPKTIPSDKIIEHTGYSFLYNESYEQANWVAYELTQLETIKVVERKNKFITDPLVATSTANDADYSGSGYDRGHMAPARDMEWSATAMAESFYYSNMSPQNPEFNRGIWNRLEQLVRTWAVDNQSVYIITGPVLKAGLQTIGPQKVAVPNYYFKVILDYTEPGIKAIGFIMQNTGSKNPLQNFAVSIDSVEKFTGIDFFPLLPDSQETLIEKTLCKNCWNWPADAIDTSTSKKAAASGSHQCQGTTKAGARCKSYSFGKSGFCRAHANQAQSNTGSPNTNAVEPDKQTGTTANGEPIYTGPRGGRYHYSKSGQKVYERK